MGRTQKKEVFGLLVLVGVIICGAVLVRFRSGSIGSEAPAVGDSVSETVSKENEVKVEPVPVDAKDIVPSKASENLKIYTHSKPKFSLDFPAEMSVETYDEGGESETILFKGPEGSFQVFISPYDGKDGLSVADIQRLQPFTQVLEPKTIQLAGVSAVLFWSTVKDIGKTREVWLSKGGWLFSVTTHADRDAWLSHIMTTWRFE